MNLKAIPIDYPPLIVWQETAAPVGGLVILTADKPANIYGVCPLKIVAGSLIERDAAEMDGWELVYNQRTLNQTLETRLAAMEKKGFVYDGRTFPLTSHARTYYAAIEKSTADVTVYDMAGDIYVLAMVNISDFIAAMNDKIKVELQPTL